VVKAELFPAHIRALGVALPYAIGQCDVRRHRRDGGPGLQERDMESGFYVYVAAVMSLGLLCAILLKDTGKHSRIVED
jgi:MHS family alpha-ketoglutarate permease-like MFS transporter